MTDSPENSISVIIPVYNRQKVLGRAVESVLCQTRPADEIIIVDDGSTDDTRLFIQKAYPALIYIYQQNKGISRARNMGIRKAHGDWLAFLDSDDEWLPSKLAAQSRALSRQPHFRICHTNEIWIRRNKRVNQGKKHEKSGGDIFEKCLPLCVISPSSVMIHRTVFETYGLFDESLPVCEDYDLWLRICAFMPVLYLPEAQVIKYGGHPDQLSHRFWGIDRFRIRALEKIIDTPGLSPEKNTMAKKEIVRKIDIYLAGALKRRKKEEVNHYQRLRKKYLQESG